MNLKCDGWQYEVPVTVTVKVNAKTNAKMKAKLSKTSLELNTNAKYAELQQLETVLSIDGISYEEYQSISVGASDAKALEMQQNLQFKTDAANGKITVRVTDAQKLAQALANKQKSFAYQVTVKLTSGTTATAKLTIKLKETVSDKVITVKTKGNIDVLDRSSSVTLTPKMSGIAGQIIDVDLQGRDAHLFDAVVNDNGTVSVYPKEGISYITKYNYLIKPVFTIDNGYMSFEAEPKADLKIKLKQGSIKKPAAQKIFLSAKSDDAYTGTLEFLNAKGETAEIKDIKLIAPKGMNGVMTLEVGADGKSYTLRHTDGRGKLVAGKSYKYNLEVRLVNQGDNEKPIKVAMTITMK